MLESLDLSGHSVHDDAHRLINERRALRSRLSLLQLLHIQTDAVRHTRQQFNITHVLEAQVLNSLSLLNLVADTSEVLQDALEHFVRVVPPQLLELSVSHTDSLGVGVHLLATISSSRVDRVEDTLKRAARPFLRDSERRQRRRQSKNLILGEASRLTLSSNRHGHVSDLRLSRNRLSTKISNLVSKDRVAVALTRCRLLQLAHHLTETTKRSRSRLDFHTRHSRELSDSLRKVLQLIRRNVHLRTKRTNLRQVSKRRSSCRRQISVRLLQLIQALCRTLSGTLHISKCALLRNTSLSSRRHHTTNASGNSAVVQGHITSSITSVLNSVLTHTSISASITRIRTNRSTLSQLFFTDTRTLSTSKLSLTRSLNTGRCTSNSGGTLRLSRSRRCSGPDLSLLQSGERLNLSKTSGLSALRPHKATLILPLLLLQRKSIILTLHRSLRTQLFSLGLSLTCLRLIQLSLSLLRLVLSLSHSIRRRSHLTHSRGSIPQLSDMVLTQVVHRASLTDELSIRRHSLIDTRRKISLTRVPSSLIQRAKRIGHRLQRRCRIAHILDLRAVKLQRIKNSPATTRRCLQRSDSTLKRTNLLFQSTNALCRLVCPSSVNVNVDLD